MVVPERANALLIPGIACPCSHPHSVECCRDLLICEPAGHLTNDIQGFYGCAAPILTDRTLLDPQLRMASACPMDKQKISCCCWSTSTIISRMRIWTIHCFNPCPRLECSKLPEDPGPHSTAVPCPESPPASPRSSPIEVCALKPPLSQSMHSSGSPTPRPRVGLRDRQLRSVGRQDERHIELAPLPVRKPCAVTAVAGAFARWLARHCRRLPAESQYSAVPLDADPRACGLAAAVVDVWVVASS